MTEDNKSLIATICEEKSTRSLSRADKLFCPNCGGLVQYNKGKIRSSYFSHKSVECEYIGSEPETADHRKGKALLYDWLKKNFPTAYIEYEVHIPQSGQIADVYVRHKEGKFTGMTWAFEFQHSNIPATDWELRHNLYESVGIQDFWFFDKKTFMKFSGARDHTDARRRSELEKTVYNKTGFVYFMDLESSKVTIDFEFTTRTSYSVIHGKKRPQEFTYHDPKEHSVELTSLRVRKSVDFEYSALVCDSLEVKMERRLRYVYSLLVRKHRHELEKRYNAQLRILLPLTIDTYGQEFGKRLKSLLSDVNGILSYRDWYIDEEDERFDKDLADLKEDILNLGAEEFLIKHKQLVDVSLRNVQEYEELKESEDVSFKVLTKETYASSLTNVSFLKAQGTSSLKEFLLSKHHDKVVLVEYVWQNHRDTLEALTKWRREFVNDKLSEINYRLRTWEQKPTALDYAMEYRGLHSVVEIDDSVQQIKDKILNYNPFSEEPDWEI
ncbi:competence protein CoiA [Paenibacillus chitinolyticus]